MSDPIIVAKYLAAALFVAASLVWGYAAWGASSGFRLAAAISGIAALFSAATSCWEALLQRRKNRGV